MKTSYFQNLYLGEPSPISEVAFTLAQEYNTRCEAYDRAVCTGPITKDGVQPANHHELGLIGRNARAVFRDVKQKAIEQGVTAEELRKAIARLP